jgi:nicotinamide mononucleotide transporter
MDPIQIVEASAVALNITYVILAAKEKILCWPFGILASFISIWLFIQIGLFAEALLFLYYVFMGIYGWWNWSKGLKEGQELNIRMWKYSRHVMIIVIGILCSILLGLTLSEWTEAKSPYFDSFTTIFSFIATWLTARKLLENWIYGLLEWRKKLQSFSA